MRKYHIRALAFLLVGLVSSPAVAGSFNEQGAFSFDEGNHGISFTTEDVPYIKLFDSEGAPSNDASSLIREESAPFEGNTALILGGANDMRAAVSLAPLRDTHEGKRVYFTLWYQAHGSDLNASIQWVSGDRDAFLEQGGTVGTVIGEINFMPTGSVTSDGWVELATRPVDFSLGSTIPASFLQLVDGHYGKSGGPQPPFLPKHLENTRVLVDAFEVHTLGDALVPDATCTAPTEQSACGDHGTCLFGKCVDATSIWGSPPLNRNGDGWIERYTNLIYSQLAPRALQFRGPLLTTELERESLSSARDFWYRYYLGLTNVGSGLNSPIRPTRPWKTTGGGGACLGPGVNDLLPNSTSDPTMMVFRLRDDVDNLVTQSLEPGDILMEVDGLPWREWIKHVPLYAFHFGTENPSKLFNGYYVMNAAMTTGATLSFARCSRQDGFPCNEDEVTTIELDLSQLHGPQLWGDAPLEDAELGYWCDWRFKPRASYPDDRGVDEYLFATTLIEGIRHSVFNSFPASANAYPERGWEPAYLETITTEPEKGFLLDVREGWGGDSDMLSRFFASFLEEGYYAFRFYSWGDGDLEKDAILQANQDLCGYYVPCGGAAHSLIYGEQYPIFAMEPRYPEKPLALLTGRNSHHFDFFLWILKETRTGPTRLFGYAQSFGDFGLECVLPQTLGERVPATVQCATALYLDGNNMKSMYLSNGVAPHEIIYQLQSDAVLGVDTVVARAEEWLEEQAALQGGQP